MYSQYSSLSLAEKKKGLDTAQSITLSCSFVVEVQWCFLGFKLVYLSEIFFFMFFKNKINILSEWIVIKKLKFDSGSWRQTALASKIEWSS